MLRSMEEAWTLFRIGPEGGFAKGQTNPGQQFPVAAFETFARSFVPRWLTTTHLHVAAFLALLERLGPSLVVCHSQGGEIVFDAHAKAPQNFASIIALEPSGYPEDGKVLTNTPTHILAGDFLDTADTWITREAAWKALGTRYSGAARFGGGNTHMLMSDLNSAKVFEEAFG